MSEHNEIDEELVIAADVSTVPAQAPAATPATGRIEPLSTNLQPSVTIDLDILSGMTEPAIVKYKDAVRRFGQSLARETSRLEEAQRAEGIDNPEVTATMVVKANDALRNPPKTEEPTSRRSYMLTQTAAFAFGIGTPVVFSVSALHGAWHWVTTLLCGAAAVGFYIYSYVIVRRK